MRYILIVLTLSSVASAAPFTFEGESYETFLPSSAVKDLPAWKPGEAEPPVLPDQAYRAAKAACEAQFGAKTDFYLLSIELRHQPAVEAGVKAYTFYEVIFSEKLSEAEFAKRRTPTDHPSVTQAYAANMSYFVLMDGSVRPPEKLASPPSQATPENRRG